jgi:hypothetical protein
MVNYANSKVYKIWSTQGNKIYIGSTTKQYLSQRMDAHRSQYKRWKDGKITMAVSSYILFDEYGVENCFIELLETKECNSKDEVLQLEGKYIRDLECVNKRVAGRTKKEYLEDNREHLKQYHEDNYERIQTYQRQYRELNKETTKEKNKQYHDLNKEKIMKRNNEKYNCECGGKYTRSGKSQHVKKIIHCKFIESQITKPEDGAE